MDRVEDSRRHMTNRCVAAERRGRPVWALVCCMWTAIASLVAAAPALASFPGRNGRIAYVDTATSEIWTVRPDGSDPRPLTSGKGSKSDPTWSADGQRLAFEWGRAIWFVSVNGSGVTQVTAPERGTWDGHPSWSPDGSQIAFERYPGIWIVNVDGSGLRLLQHSDRRFDRAPDWSPDGTRIAFTSVRRTNSIHPTDVWTMGVRGQGRTRVTNDIGWDYDPSWSPDGERIAYEHWRDIDAAGDIAWTHVVNSDGTDQIELNPTGAEYPEDLGPAWSPNGNRLVFWSVGILTLATMYPDGSDLVSLDIIGSSPAWRPLE